MARKKQNHDVTRDIALDNQRARTLGVSYGQYKAMQHSGMIDKLGNFTDKGKEFGYVRRYCGDNNVVDD